MCTLTSESVLNLFTYGLNADIVSSIDSKNPLDVEQGVTAKERCEVKSFDVFLAHEWGDQESNFSTHQRVMNVANQLRKTEPLAVSVWVDDERLRVSVDESIIEGVLGSKKAAVFLTRRYLNRLESDDNNCTCELRFCLEKLGRKRIVLVIFDQDLNDRRNWSDKAQYLFPDNMVWVDLSTEEAMARNFSRFVEEIHK